MEERIEPQEKIIEPQFLIKYRKADPDRRLSLMLENYKAFPNLIRKDEKIITYLIKSERAFSRSHFRGELDVKVQTSRKGDPTADEAVENVSLEEAFASGEIDRSILTGVKNAADYEADIHFIKILKMDYELLQEIIEGLDECDSKVIKDYLLERKLYREIADDMDRTYDGIRKRMKRIKKDIRDEIIEYLELNCCGGGEC